jgi:hypothetical protein
LITKNPSEKYTQLLEGFNNFLESNTRNVASLTKTKIQIFEELYNISFFHYKQSNLDEAIQALMTGIEKMLIWHSGMDWKNQQRIQLINEKYHIALEQFITSIIAPRALANIYHSINLLSSKPYYLILSEKANLFLISEKADRRNNIPEILFSKLNSNLREELNFNILDYCYKKYGQAWQRLLSQDQFKKANFIILSWLQSRKKVINPLFQQKVFEFIYDECPSELKVVISIKLADLAESIPSDKLEINLLNYYCDTNQVRLLEVFFEKNHLDSNALSVIIKDLDKLKGPLSLIQKTEIAAYSKSWELLINYLKQSPDLDFIMKFDSKVPENFYDDLLHIYLRLSIEFLEGHIGQKSQTKIATVARHLKTRFRTKFHSSYISQLKLAFPNRKFILQI